MANRARTHGASPAARIAPEIVLSRSAGAVLAAVQSAILCYTDVPPRLTKGQADCLALFHGPQGGSMAKWFVMVRELRVREGTGAPAEVEHFFLNEHSAKEFGRRLHREGKYIIVDGIVVRLKISGNQT